MSDHCVFCVLTFIAIDTVDNAIKGLMTDLHPRTRKMLSEAHYLVQSFTIQFHSLVCRQTVYSFDYSVVLYFVCDVAKFHTIVLTCHLCQQTNY